jgi:hypothetical protein
MPKEADQLRDKKSSITRRTNSKLQSLRVNLLNLRSPDEMIHRKSVPQEEQRLQVAQAFFHPTVHDLKEYVQ